MPGLWCSTRLLLISRVNYRRRRVTILLIHYPHSLPLHSFCHWMNCNLNCVPADKETPGGKEEASSHQWEFAGAADSAGRHRREYSAPQLHLSLWWRAGFWLSWSLTRFLFLQFHSKMENAEVLEMTVKKVEDILKNKTQGMLHSNHTASWWPVWYHNTDILVYHVYQWDEPPINY